LENILTKIDEENKKFTNAFPIADLSYLKGMLSFTGAQNK